MIEFDSLKLLLNKFDYIYIDVEIISLNYIIIYKYNIIYFAP